MPGRAGGLSASECPDSGSRLIGTLQVDLEEFGIDWLRVPERGSSKVSYSDEVVSLLDRAAVIAKADGYKELGIDHVLVAFRAEESKVLEEWKRAHGVDERTMARGSGGNARGLAGSGSVGKAGIGARVSESRGSGGRVGDSCTDSARVCSFGKIASRADGGRARDSHPARRFAEVDGANAVRNVGRIREKTEMSMYVVERELPGITPEALQSAGVRAKSCCAEMTTEGEPVKWIRSFFLPASAQTHCYFEAGSQTAVEEANQRAKIPFVRVVEVVEMTPEAV